MCWCVPQESWRFTHNRDIVPSWPPQWVGFHHLPREVWQVDFGVAGVRCAVFCLPLTMHQACTQEQYTVSSPFATRLGSLLRPLPTLHLLSAIALPPSDLH